MRDAATAAGWLKLPIGLLRDPRVIALDNDAGMLLLASWSYAAAHRTDGMIPTRLASTLHPVADPAACVVALVCAGLWIETPAGFDVSGFLDLNPSAADRGALAAQRSAAGKIGAAGRWTSKAKPKAKPKKEKESKPKKEEEPERKIPDTPHARVIDTFHTGYRIATGGSVPTWTGPAVSAVKRILKSHSEKDVIDRMSRFFREQVPAFIWRDGVPDFASFVQHFDKLNRPVLGREDTRSVDAMGIYLSAAVPPSHRPTATRREPIHPYDQTPRPTEPLDGLSGAR